MMPRSPNGTAARALARFDLLVFFFNFQEICGECNNIFWLTVLSRIENCVRFQKFP